MSNLPISFEVYPPRSSDAVPALYEAINSLALLDPAFISVTFGAGGSETKNSLEVLNYIQSTDVAPLAHLTCVGTTCDSARALVAEFVEAGILDFLALRGDFPEGTSNLPPGSLSTAADLVEVIADVRGQDGITAVAAFPNGHPESGSDRSDIKALLAKQDAGADFAITQLFFEANDYVSFVELARSAGVEIPILPGIMPIISPKRLARVLELTGERNPTELEARLLNAQDSDARIEAGIDFASKLVTDLVEAGAPGIHLYAFNEHDRVTEVLRRADLVS